MVVNPAFGKVFDIPQVPTPKQTVDPTPPYIRPEAKPPVVYDVPIPRTIHAQDISIVNPRTGTTLTKTIPAYEETVTRTMDPTHGDVIAVKDVGTGTIDLFPVKGGLPAIIDPKSKRSTNQAGETVFVTEFTEVIQKGFWGLPGQGLQGKTLFEITTGVAPPSLPGLPDLEGLGNLLLIGGVAVGGLYVLGKLLGRRK